MTTSKSEYKLQCEQELRFEVHYKKEPVEMTLVQGRAEVFAQDIALNTPYIFPAGSKVAIYSWHGCTLELKGIIDDAYTASHTPMRLYVNTHACLERLRLDSAKGLPKNKFPRGPIAMIAGPSDVGKSTLCHILLNYAVRKGRTPIYVDLDVGQGSISVPGTIGLVVVKNPISIEEGIPQDGALVHHFGHTAPSKNITLYKILVSKLANSVREIMESDNKIGASGVIINTCGWTTHGGYRLLVHCAEAFKVDPILVLEEEGLYYSLQSEITFINVVYLPKSGGVVKRSRDIRVMARDDRIKHYFYGRKTKCQPHTLELEFSQLQVFKIGETNSCDWRSGPNMTGITSVEPGTIMKNSMLTISNATKSEDLLNTNVKGFLVVIAVHTDRGTLSVLSTQPKLSKCLLIQSEVFLMDSG